jgi:hypothetical protein
MKTAQVKLRVGAVSNVVFVTFLIGSAVIMLVSSLAGLR